MKAAITGMLVLAISTVSCVDSLQAEGDWEMTRESEVALKRGLEWLAKNQGNQGNWGSNDLGLVGMGALAFLADGHMPKRGRYGEVVEKALGYVIRNGKPSGLLNIGSAQRDMYNHGLATFVLGQAHGMTSDKQIGRAIDRALKLIYNTQGADGGWPYQAVRASRGHDLSLAVMQAKAIRSAVDSGLEVPPKVVQMAIQGVRIRYRAQNGARGNDPKIQQGPGAFTYNGGNATLAMAAAGVVCMQEFGQYDDWRIPKSMRFITEHIARVSANRSRDGKMPFDAYTLYYVGQALYQVGGDDWEKHYPKLRDSLVGGQHTTGYWDAGKHVGGNPGKLYGTAVACFILAIPNRYLPILQEGKIESLKTSLGQD